jgi:hypothetical protein
MARGRSKAASTRAAAVEPLDAVQPLVCAAFSLEFFQKWTIPGTQITRTNTIILEVLDTNGDRYILGTQTASDEADLIASLFDRIARKKGKTGWTFEGSNGIITG